MAKKPTDDGKKKLAQGVKSRVEAELDASAKRTDVAYSCTGDRVFKCKEGGYDCVHPDKCEGNNFEAIA